MAKSDSELIQRTLQGDDSAFAFLVDKYKGAVHALAYRKLGDFHTAEEIAQDAFLKAYQKPYVSHQQRPKRSLKSPMHPSVKRLRKAHSLIIPSVPSARLKETKP